MKPSSAGSSVTAAPITITTASIAASAAPYRYGRPIKNSPTSEITTVAPAISTERPAVEIASTAASRGSRPAAIAARWRARMSSA
jgi:hypothetical protein